MSEVHWLKSSQTCEMKFGHRVFYALRPEPVQSMVVACMGNRGGGGGNGEGAEGEGDGLLCA